MAAKYRDKRISITTVQDQYPSYDIFQTHLNFHYLLPLSCEYLREFLKKTEPALMGYSGAGGKRINEKNLKAKIM
jgi:hypothetical protein